MTEISWIIPNVSYTPESYTVHYAKNDTPGDILRSDILKTSKVLEEFLNLDETKYSILLTSLSSFTMYKYQVFSKNSHGTSHSDVKYFLTDETGKCVCLQACPRNYMALFINAIIKTLIMSLLNSVLQNLLVHREILLILKQLQDQSIFSGILRFMRKGMETLKSIHYIVLSNIIHLNLRRFLCMTT